MSGVTGAAVRARRGHRHRHVDAMRRRIEPHRPARRLSLRRLNDGELVRRVLVRDRQHARAARRKGQIRLRGRIRCRRRDRRWGSWSRPCLTCCRSPPSCRRTRSGADGSSRRTPGRSGLRSPRSARWRPRVLDRVDDGDRALVLDVDVDAVTVGSSTASSSSPPTSIVAMTLPVIGSNAVIDPPVWLKVQTSLRSEGTGCCPDWRRSVRCRAASASSDRRSSMNSPGHCS